MTDLLLALHAHPLYLLTLAFFAFYPIASSLTWIATSLIYYFTRERSLPDSFYDLGARAPSVSVIIPTFCEAATIAHTLDGVLAMDYPEFEVLVVDDGSTDDTLGVVMEYVRAGHVRVVRKALNEGKAMALNDAIPCAGGELVLVIDADAVPELNLLRSLVPHFKSARVAGVTGNPRVANRGTFLTKLQLMEFASIVSLLRRSQRVWGRLLTMSGVVGIFRRSSLIDVGLYSPDMSTEDIDLTWKLQRKHYDIRYEPRAVVWMQVPPTFGGLFRQRFRWAKGLAEVLRRHGGVCLRWRDRRLWPVVAEAVLSISWAYCVVGLFVLWFGSALFRLPHVGVSPFFSWWALLIASVCILQLAVGMFLERRYDRGVTREFWIAIFYPLVYWVFMAVVTVVATPAGMFGPLHRTPVRWRTARE
jgi:biofilm PGA synthesis N-glycosyltransferase PgaC